ncbi:hypothetical protein [Curtobacterium oceanosedimentum]|uniref:hypothetical protein n=1 Tax=Curtobacterium oceanosedimentum TaxID=465820 RepID=UPI00339556BE
MAARTGLFTAPVPGTPPVGSSPLDGRRVLGALYGTAFQVLSGGGIAQSSSSMAFTVGQTVWGIPDPTDSAAVFLSPSDAVTITPAQGPSTGSRKDIIQVKQNDYGNNDPDSRMQVVLKAGAAGGSPTAPTPDAGYQLFATITVPTNATNAAACTITPATSSTLLLPTLQAPTFQQLSLITTSQPFQQAVVTADPNPLLVGPYYWTGTAWRFQGPRLAYFTTLIGGLVDGSQVSAGSVTEVPVSEVGDDFATISGSDIKLAPGIYSADWEVALGAGATGRSYVTFAWADAPNTPLKRTNIAVGEDQGGVTMSGFAVSGSPRSLRGLVYKNNGQTTNVTGTWTITKLR